MRAALGLCMVGSAMAIVEVDSLDTVGGRTCGNCYKTLGDRTVCNTGGDETRTPYRADQQLSATQIEQQGVSTAQAMPIGDLKAAVGDKWKTMFCASYLDMYKYDVNLPDTATADERRGAACVRDLSAASILAADEEARQLYNKFGTTNGYPSSYAEPSGEAVTSEMRRFGVDGEGDVPSNWCGTYMRYMLCHVAFPQVTKTPTEVRARRAEAGSNGVDVAEGRLRTVELDSCETLFRHCNRREPTDDEVKSDYVHPSMVGARPLFFEDGKVSEVEGALDNSRYCNMWRKGYGLAQAGTGVSDEDGDSTITFSAAGAPAVSVAVAVAFALVALLL